MRHAKSDWSVAGQKDFDRSLNQRGLEAAPKMGTFLKDTANTPSVIFSSPAKRALQTCELVADAVGFDKDKIQFNRDFYYGSVEDYFSTLKTIQDNQPSALMVGHNPLVEQFIGYLCQGSNTSLVQMPTAGIACIEFYGERWSDLYPNSGRLKWFMIPKLLS
jgi:phosphohistidine phosphatase